MSKSNRFDPDADYTVTDGLIANPGKFQGEPFWLPMLWDRVMNGFSDKSVHDGSMAIDGFRLDANLCALTGMDVAPGSFLCLWSDDQGFVSHMVMTEQELNDCEGFDLGAGDYLDFQETDVFDGRDLNAY